VTLIQFITVDELAEIQETGIGIFSITVYAEKSVNSNGM